MRSVLRVTAAVAAISSIPGTAQSQELAAAVPTPVVATALPRGVMAPVVMREMTPTETRAHQVWSLRAALNVAALQCQFSPFLRTVDSYNTIINQHARELAAAYTLLQGYFRRAGARAPGGNFDRYSTMTYNNFSTLQAQFAFCQTAARIGKEALYARRGELGNLAAMRMRELRSSLVPAPERYAFDRQPIRLSPISLAPPPPPDCSQLRGRDRRDCEQQQRQR